MQPQVLLLQLRLGSNTQIGVVVKLIDGIFKLFLALLDLLVFQLGSYGFKKFFILRVLNFSSHVEVDVRSLRGLLKVSGGGILTKLESVAALTLSVSLRGLNVDLRTSLAHITEKRNALDRLEGILASCQLFYFKFE